MNYKELIKNYLDANGKVKIYPSKRKYKIYILMYLSEYFEENKTYTEKEVNEIIDEHTLFKDSALIRREMYNLKLFDREKDCSKYYARKIK